MQSNAQVRIFILHSLGQQKLVTILGTGRGASDHLWRRRRRRITLDDPFRERLIARNSFHEPTRQRIELILVECPLFEKSARRLVLEIDGLFFLCFILNSVTREAPYDEAKTSRQESEEPCPSTPADRIHASFLQH
jgi:hypothetical protein